MLEVNHRSHPFSSGEETATTRCEESAKSIAQAVFSTSSKSRRRHMFAGYAE